MSKTYNFAPVTLLIVDGNGFMRGIVSRLCRSFGFRTILDTGSQQEALRILARCGVDIVVCDLDLDEGDGFTLMLEVRRAPMATNPYVPILVLTDQSRPRNVVAARDAGATEFLKKPISAATLLERIVYVVEQPRPFVRAPTFVGPDRRRRQEPFDGEDRRKSRE